LCQAEAINRGFQLSSGEIFAFLNADDVYLPGAVSTAVQALSLDRSAAAVCGKAYLMDGSGQRVGSFATGKPDLEGLRRECVICQPAVFAPAPDGRTLPTARYYVGDVGGERRGNVLSTPTTMVTSTGP
jgi:glycosyltransferase involved in cell wall biosynthesis